MKRADYTAFLPLTLAATLLFGTASAHAQKAKHHAPRTRANHKQPAKSPAPAVSPAERLQFSSPAFLRIYGLRPGMTRAEVSRLYRPDGGFFSQMMQTFICQEDPSLGATFGIIGVTYGNKGDVLKIDVCFAPAAATTGGSSWEKDGVVSVSEPYFEPVRMN